MQIQRDATRGIASVAGNGGVLLAGDTSNPALINGPLNISRERLRARLCESGRRRDLARACHWFVKKAQFRRKSVTDGRRFHAKRPEIIETGDF